jgi:hypothetical protein
MKRIHRRMIGAALTLAIAACLCLSLVSIAWATALIIR